MKFLSAPWRWNFISGTSKKDCCVFCHAVTLPDKESLICYRGTDYYVIMNKYPYNTAHLMIVPYEHVDTPEKIQSEKAVEMWVLMNRSMAIIREAFCPSGFNVGMNIGQVAGAGVKDHCHIHIVPRWEGDSNFMPIVGGTRVMSYSMETVFETLYKKFNP